MSTANCSTFDKNSFDAAADMLCLYGYFFPLIKYLTAVVGERLTFHEVAFRDALFQNFNELEDEYQRNLLISFGEHQKIKPFRSLDRPALKYQMTLANAWDYTFEAFGTVEVFMAGLAIRTNDIQGFSHDDFCFARNRILSALKRLYKECLSFIGGCYLGHSFVLEHAHIIVKRLDEDRVFE